MLSDVAKTLAPEYKQVPMAVSSFGVMMQPNLSSITASYLEMGYSNCWLLTKMSKDGRIGMVGAQKAPFETEQMEGCKVGAVAANPNAKIVLVNSNSFTDTQANREQVKGLLDQGITEINLMSGTEDAVGGLRLCEIEQRPLHHMGWRCAFLGTQINRDNHGPRLGRGHGRTGEAGPQR